MSRWLLAERGALVLAVVAAALGLLTSAGFHVVPPGPPDAAWVVHVGLFLLSLVAGGFGALRHREIEQQRWAVAHDRDATKGEREYAHREAASQRRYSWTVFLLAPLAVGYWMAYVFETPDAITLSDFVLVTPVAGFFLGLYVGGMLWPARGAYDPP
ncbi:MAG: hypothetical protein KDD11_23500 [Acidobacteria bacterium]|nr:hypothetical protein [Acidobacteriota bacterium]